jgi:phage tail protein X
MSDGVWRYASYDTIGALARRYYGHELAQALRQLVLQDHGALPDDFSLIAIARD